MAEVLDPELITTGERRDDEVCFVGKARTPDRGQEARTLEKLSSTEGTEAHGSVVCSSYDLITHEERCRPGRTTSLLGQVDPPEFALKTVEEAVATAECSKFPGSCRRSLARETVCY